MENTAGETPLGFGLAPVPEFVGEKFYCCSGVSMYGGQTKRVVGPPC